MTENTTRTLSVRGLYLQLTGIRIAEIRRGTWRSGESPEGLAETLTLAAVALAQATIALGGPRPERARAAIVGHELMREAFRHDLAAADFADRALDELDEAPDVSSSAFVREAADCLMWAGAALRQRAEHAGAGRSDLVAMCSVQAADLLAGADRLALGETRTTA